MTQPSPSSDEQLRSRLTPEQYRVTQQKGTERPFSGEYWNHFEPGEYRCIVCGELLFDSSSKFDAGCGWPSFFQTAAPGAVDTQEDRSHGMVRDEIGLRYCVNSASLRFGS
ncbi:MAG: peptide-methionine (R)-S-oxide reductase [Planctomycetota bacterium]|nr:MAG: peptide-methionine (R)-S-oxide reductase [Planctomycetota bacterium]